MAGRCVRKITTSGNSLAVTIPRAYANFHELKRGEKVDVIYGDLFLLIPPAFKRKLKNQKKLITRLVG